MTGRYSPETHRRWYEANRERKIAQVKARYQADAERIKAHKRAYRTRRPVEIRVINANWRARQLGIPGTLTTEAVNGRLELWGWCCWQCGAPWEELDHVLPLARGGPNLPANIRPSCGRCNKLQAARLMNEANAARRREVMPVSSAWKDL
jgi:5-methylcytosine-specific restriction endonuclease McrA